MRFTDYYCLCTGDDLITPVYVPPTRPPTTTPKVTPSSQCDDEDCVTGSGSGEVTTEDNSTGKSGKGKLNCVQHAQCEETAEWCMILREITHRYAMQRCSICLQIFLYRGADKSLARPGRKQANVSVRMA